MRRNVLIIADDLTGALDSAAPFANKGYKVAVAISPEHLDSAIRSGAAIIAVNTASRDMSPTDAAETVEQCAAKLSAIKPSIAFKKIDSRLYGNASEEIDAALRGFNLKKTIISPAIPELGRTVEDGHVVGFGVEHPISVGEALSGLRGRYEIPDVYDVQALDVLAARILTDDGILVSGALGLATAISNAIPKGANPLDALKVDRPILFAIGSRDQATYNSLEFLLEKFPETIKTLAPNGRLPELSCSADISVYLTTQGQISEPKSVVSKRFAHAVRDQILISKPSTLILTGGDTANGILRALGTGVIFPRGIVSAMPWFKMPGPSGRETTVFTKSGGLGDPELFASIVAGNKWPDLL